jgi:hypothetical protein
VVAVVCQVRKNNFMNIRTVFERAGLWKVVSTSKVYVLYDTYFVLDVMNEKEYFRPLLQIS